MMCPSAVCVVMDSRGDSGDHSDALSGVQCGTVLPAAHWYIDSMQFTFARSALVVAWIALVSGVGLVTGAASVLHWVTLASVAVIPPVLACTLSRASFRAPLLRVQESRR